jgi:hypothetical protein
MYFGDISNYVYGGEAHKNPKEIPYMKMGGSNHMV